jgi:uncharacterized protein (TIGR02466 family)
MANQSADRTGDESMQLLELFPTIVGVFEYYGFDRDAPAWRASVVEELTERERKLGAPQGQTDDRLHERPELANLMAFFRRCAADYVGAFRYRPTLELRLQGCWATTLLRGDHLEMHEHANSFLSGAFYLDVDATAPPIRFWDPRPQARSHDIPAEAELRINRRFYEIEASNGRLVLFPSWLQHRVRPSMSDIPRTSVSFNLTLHGEVGIVEHHTRAAL